jgi:phage terminase small subunit
MGRVRKSKISPEGLTFKQKKFADKYLETGNGTQSALATYDTNSEVARRIATENLSKPVVEDYIVSKLTHKDLTPQLILNKLLESVESLNPAEKLKSLELLGKHLKMFVDKTDATNQLEQVKSIGWATNCSNDECKCSCHGNK